MRALMSLTQVLVSVAAGALLCFVLTETLAQQFRGGPPSAEDMELMTEDAQLQQAYERQKLECAKTGNVTLVTPTASEGKHVSFTCVSPSDPLYRAQHNESPPPVASIETGKHYERAVLKQVVPALRSTNNVGRIYYKASCPPGDLEFPLPFPRVDVLPPLTGATDVDVVRSIFRQTRESSVVEKVGGIIQIRLGKAPDAILRTRIHRLNLTPIEQFNPSEVIDAIAHSPEVRSAMEELHVVRPQRIYSMILREPADGLPHLPAEISDVTMDQALDMIARMWSGVVLYGACTGTGMYEVSFADSTRVVGSSLE